MTRQEIKNIPEIVDFMLDKSVIADSREKVRKRLEEVCDLAIKALEQTTWIPIGRLPEKNVKVLATTEWGEVTIAEIFGNGDWFIRQGASNANADDILAWMPLPQAYKGE